MLTGGSSCPIGGLSLANYTVYIAHIHRLPVRHSQIGDASVNLPTPFLGTHSARGRFWRKSSALFLFQENSGWRVCVPTTSTTLWPRRPSLFLRAPDCTDHDRANTRISRLAWCGDVERRSNGSVAFAQQLPLLANGAVNAPCSHESKTWMQMLTTCPHMSTNGTNGQRLLLAFVNRSLMLRPRANIDLVHLTRSMYDMQCRLTVRSLVITPGEFSLIRC